MHGCFSFDQKFRSVNTDITYDIKTIYMTVYASKENDGGTEEPADEETRPPSDLTCQ
jgi:hypothetical protein